MSEPKNNAIEQMFDDDDNDSIVHPSPEREALSEQIGNIISTNSLFEQQENIQTYEKFRENLSLNSTIHHPKTKKKVKVGQPRKSSKLLFID